MRERAVLKETVPLFCKKSAAKKNLAALFALKPGTQSRYTTLQK
jgi:hypothetical protein